MAISRRSFMISLIGVAFVGASVVKILRMGPKGAEDLELDLSAMVQFPESAKEIGKIYYGTLAQKLNPEQILKQIFTQAELEYANLEELQGIISDKIQQDFKKPEEAVVSIHAWRLSQTEALLCALLYRASQSE